MEDGHSQARVILCGTKERGLVSLQRFFVLGVLHISLEAQHEIRTWQRKAAIQYVDTRMEGSARATYDFLQRKIYLKPKHLYSNSWLSLTSPGQLSQRVVPFGEPKALQDSKAHTDISDKDGTRNASKTFHLATFQLSFNSATVNDWFMLDSKGCFAWFIRQNPHGM